MKLSRAQWILESKGYLEEEVTAINIDAELDSIKEEINSETDSFMSKIFAKIKSFFSKAIHGIKKFVGMDEADARLSKKARPDDKFQAPRWAKMEPDEVFGYEKAAADKLHHFGSDNNGMNWVDVPNTLEMAKLAYCDGRLKRTHSSSLDIRDWMKSSSFSKSTMANLERDYNQNFAKQYAEMERQIKKKGTVTIYRGTGIGEWRDGSTHRDSAHFDDTSDRSKLLTKFKLMLRNAKYRNSWSLNSDVAIDYAGDHEYRYLMIMEAYPYEYSLPFSAWLEGFWKGGGSYHKDYAANDEVNMFQSFKVRDIKIYALSDKAAQFFRQATKTTCPVLKSSNRSDIASMVSTLSFKEAWEKSDYMNGQFTTWDKARMDAGRLPYWAKKMTTIGPKPKKLTPPLSHSETAMRKVTDPRGLKEPYTETDLKRDNAYYTEANKKIAEEIAQSLCCKYKEADGNKEHASIFVDDGEYRIYSRTLGYYVMWYGYSSIFNRVNKECKKLSDVIHFIEKQESKK